MQDITQNEALYLREHLPTAYIVITSKRKKGRSKHYAVEETTAVNYWLKKYRDSLNIEVFR